MNEQEKKPSNPSLFPDPMRGAEQSYSNQSPWQLDTGATLRDFFANSAMQSIIIRLNGNPLINWGQHGESTLELLSKDAYSIADAMLKQREL